MMRTRPLRVMLVVAAVAASPALLVAQKPASSATMPATHTVAAGETLWGLAQRYLNDAHRWREIYDLNKSDISDPHWIYPGQVLKLPGAVTSVAVSVTPVPVSPPADTGRRVEPPAEPTVNPATAPTVFKRAVEAPRPQRSQMEDVPEQPTVARGEFARAPYVVQTGSLSGAGTLVGTTDLDAQGRPARQWMFKAYDDVLLEAPAGMVLKPGDEVVALARGPSLPGLGDVVVPTGVIRVTKSAVGDQGAVGQVVQLFGSMQQGQLLMALDTAGIGSTVRPQAVQGGRSASIQWIQSSPVLPSLQSYAVVNLTAADSVKPGDRFQVFRAPVAGAAQGTPATPEISIGSAQAVKVTPFGTTIVITAQEQPAINVGSLVRVSARIR